MKSLFVLMLVILSVTSMATNANSSESKVSNEISNEFNYAEDVVHIGAELLKELDGEIVSLEQDLEDKQNDMAMDIDPIEGKMLAGEANTIEVQIESLKERVSELVEDQLNTETRKMILDDIRFVKREIAKL